MSCLNSALHLSRNRIGLHMTAEENALRSDGDSSPEQGEMFPVWSSGGDDWEGSEGTSSFDNYEHNVDNAALAGGIDLPHGNGPFMPRNEGCVLGELAVPTSFAVFTVPEHLSCGIVSAKKPFSQHGRAVT